MTRSASRPRRPSARCTTRPLASAAALALALAGAARADELTWGLGDATARYDLTVEQAPAPPPSPGPVLAPLRLVRQADLAEGRRPARPPADPGELVWHYALAVPAGDVGGRNGLDAPIEDEFAFQGGLGVRSKGVHAARVRGKRVVVRTAVELTPTGRPGWLAGGQLVVERTFAPREGRLEAAQFQLELRCAPLGADGKYGAPQPARWAGRIEAGAGLEPAGRDFHARVQEAIDRGAAWLRKGAGDRLGALKANPGHQALGHVALPTYALLRSGVAPGELEPFFEWMDRQPFHEVYSVALYVMVLDARSITRTPLPPQARTRSVARFGRQPTPQADRARMAAAARWLLGARKQGEGWWSYGGKVVPPGPARDKPGLSLTPQPGLDPDRPLGHDLTAEATGGDRSNSQFAVLALHSAMAAGLEVPGAVWEELLAEQLEGQAKDGPPVDGAALGWAAGAPLGFDARDHVALGTTTERPKTALTPEERARARARGWDYPTKRAANNAYGSMTGAGLSSVAAAREGLEATRRLTHERDRAALEAMRDGLGWFLEHWSPAANAPRGDAWYYYYLYSVEKAMDLAGVERLGPHEWWREGASELLARQRADGSWNGDTNDSSFALLFLNRATLPAKLDVGEARRVATGAGAEAARWDEATIPGVGRVSMRQVLLAVGQAGPRELKERLDLADKGLAALPEDTRPRLLPELTELLEAPVKQVKKWASDRCKELAGSDDPARVADFGRRWEALLAATASGDPARIPGVLEVVRDAEAPPPLRQAAIDAAARLRAIEVVGDLIALAEHRDAALRERAAITLAAMGGYARPLDAKATGPARRAQLDAWRAWWKEEGPALVRAEEVRRAVEALADPARADAAARTLEGAGRLAWRPLVDGLRRDASKARAHKLLVKLTGQKLPATPDPWLEWLERQPR